MKFTLLILTLNEIEGLKKILPQIKKTFRHEIIVMDGHSTDGTLEYLKKNKIKFYKQKKSGLGPAYNEAIKKCSGDIVITFSPDGNSDVNRLNDLMKLMSNNIDIGIVSRYKDWAKSYDDDNVTSFGNWLFTGIYNFFYKQSISDLLVIFRAFKKSLVSELNINHEGIAWTTMMMCRAAKKNKIIGEIPGNEPLRIGGKRKMNPIINGLAEIKMLIKEFFK